MTAQAIIEKLKNFPLWNIKNGKATRTFKFRNYSETLAFVNTVANLAEKMNHHPDINFGYNKLEVSYQTHDANNQITAKDMKAIAAVEQLIAGDD